MNAGGIVALRGGLAGSEGKNDPPELGRCRVAGKHDEFPDAAHLREERKRDITAEARAAMPTKNKELA